MLTACWAPGNLYWVLVPVLSAIVVNLFLILHFNPSTKCVHQHVFMFGQAMSLLVLGPKGARLEDEVEEEI